MSLDLSGFSVHLPKSSQRFASLPMAAKLGLVTLGLVSLPGCQSVAGSATVSQVRIIDASPDAPGMDAYQNSEVLAYNLGLGTITSYVPITPGISTISLDSAGTKQQLVSASGSFLKNGQYTVLVSNFAASLEETILTDQTIPAPSGDISLRMIDASAKAGSLDIYLVPSGSTIVDTTALLTSVSFGSNSGYLNLPTGTYTLIALPAGTVPTAKGATLYTGASVVYAGGTAQTLVFTDAATSSTTATVNVVTANDYVPE